ncbi:unnamed protein product [Rhizoctonia solani]|uniref:Uncharacterized protein n=1 Tax=Rhizoctonia solani TaxID=456999 RepID=A0A8H3HD61_9AGAM|nr:hypothetical protein RHS04_00976 [Rhizoctonia solani]KAF8752290.1 hypothetical protein RHS01_07948 [Rhizoctonia solani]CAE6498810.1 unnamed protein product [Rhizoctonia solani]
MSRIEDGLYVIGLPFGESYITDPGEGRFLPLLPTGNLGKDANKIKLQYKEDKGAYSLQFEKSGKYLTFEGPPSINNKLLDGDKPRYFKIEAHPYAQGQYAIKVAEDKKFHIGLAMERIFPPWVAMNSFPEVQSWVIKKA